MSAAEKVKEIRDDVVAAVAMAEKLTVSTAAYELGNNPGFSVQIGDPATDDLEIARFRHVEDAETLAAELNKAFQPIIEHYSRKFLRTLCQDVHDALDALERG